MPLDLDQIERYHRQMLLPEWGAAGQERIGAARVAVRGRGPAAAVAVRYLAGAGVGALLVEDEPCAPGPRITAQVEPGGPASCIECGDHREVTGAAGALEAIKAILGLPHRSLVELPRLHQGRGASAP